MSVFPNHGQWDASNVRTDGARVLAYEKGTTDRAFDHIDYGALALRRTLIEALPPSERHGLEEIQTRVAREGRMRAVVATERFYEIGSEEGLLALDARLRSV